MRRPKTIHSLKSEVGPFFLLVLTNPLRNTANIAKKSVFNALSIGGGLDKVALLPVRVINGKIFFTET